MQLISIENKQTVTDLAIQYGGKVDAAVDIALLNNLSLTEELPVGHVMQKPLVLNSAVADFFTKELKSPANKSETEGTGIGFMKIGIDFTIR